MPLKLNVGLCRKVGLPDYGSMGASCNLEVELDGALLQGDRQTLHRNIRDAYAVCRQAIEEQLEEESGRAPSARSSSNGQANGSHSMNGNGHGRSHSSKANGTSRQATNSQVRAIHAIASRQGLDLTSELRSRYGVEMAEDLSVAQASQLIDSLKGAHQGNGGGR